MRSEPSAAWSQPLQRYATLFELLTPALLPDLAALLAENVTFRDPFNAIAGRASVIGIFRHMFESLEAPSFLILDRAIGTGACYLRWRMQFRRRLRPQLWQIEGISEVVFDADGLVLSHIDHWDAASQLYEHVPVLGAMLRLAKRRLAARP